MTALLWEIRRAREAWDALYHWACSSKINPDTRATAVTVLRIVRDQIGQAEERLICSVAELATAPSGGQTKERDDGKEE